MNYAKLRYNDIANGEGIRTTLFVSGCTFHCPGCFNAEAQSFTYGQKYNEQTVEDIIESMYDPMVSGLTLLGGDPLCQDKNGLLNLILLAHEVHTMGKTTWMWSGYTWENLIADETKYLNITWDNLHDQINNMLPVGSMSENTLRFILAHTVDVFVDGQFIQDKADVGLKWKGSSNQRVIDVKKSHNTGILTLYE